MGGGRIEDPNTWQTMSMESASSERKAEILGRVICYELATSAEESLRQSYHVVSIATWGKVGLPFLLLDVLSYAWMMDVLMI